MAPSTKKRTATTKKTAAEESPTRGAGVAAAAVTPTYKVKNAFPADPTVRILFHGLLNFFFADKTACTVGVHNTTQGIFPPHRHPHNFHVRVRIIPSAGDPVLLPLPPPITDPKLIQGVNIAVSGARDLDGVYVFQDSGGFNRPEVPSNPNNPKDWRWVVDIESDLLYPEKVSDRTTTINPSVRINNGLFYTVLLTGREFIFRPQDGSGDRPVGRVAEYVGADIYLTSTGKLDLTVAPLQTLSLPAGHGVRYQIDIVNDCQRGGDPCTFRPQGPAKEDRNDFYLYYDTFVKPADRPEYELRCPTCPATETSGEDVTEKLEELGFYTRGQEEKFRSNNEAPCGPVVQGQSPTPSGV